MATPTQQEIDAAEQDWRYAREKVDGAEAAEEAASAKLANLKAARAAVESTKADRQSNAAAVRGLLEKWWYAGGITTAERAFGERLADDLEAG